MSVGVLVCGARRAARSLLALVAFAAVACGGDADSPPGDGPAGELRVAAASSLTEAFEEAGDAFRRQHPGVELRFNFASSSALAAQIVEGAPADVFAAADHAQVAVVVERGLARDPVVFAQNVPVVVVPAKGSPVASFADLARPAVRLVLAGPDVPIGRYAREVLARAAADPQGPGAGFADDVLANLRSNEANVRAVLTKVQLGEADAGIVYATDARVAGGDVRVIAIPDAYAVLAEYPIVVLGESRNPAAARAWVEFLTGPEGRAILARHGFRTPGP